MKVELVNYTHNALETLLYTKDTRLQGEQSLQDIVNWSEKDKLKHLAYMKDTIQSSWEFVDYTFKISGVTRAFTHQLVRTRTGSYAQESQRTVDVRHSHVINTCDIEREMYNEFADQSMSNYQFMIDHGIHVQDARGLLPTNIETSIIAKFDLRTLHNMALLRLCTRTQGEYQRVFRAMMDEVVKIHPWAEDFLKVHCVWYGVCAFPRYDRCPVQKHTLFYGNGHNELIQDEWEKADHEAVPVAINGRTM